MYLQVSMCVRASVLTPSILARSSEVRAINLRLPLPFAAATKLDCDHLVLIFRDLLDHSFPLYTPTMPEIQSLLNLILLRAVQV
jgi:hypothetical protein